MSEPLNDKIAPEVDRLIADGRPFIRCACGFLAVSADEYENRIALEEHPCPHRGEETVEYGETRWYHRVFSLYGLLIVIVLAWAVLAGLGKAKS